MSPQAVAAILLGLWKGLGMLKIGMQIVSVVFLAVTAAEMEHEGAGRGAEKKAAATARLTSTLDELLPDYLDPVIALSAGWLIDAVVVLLNRTGFFGQLALA